MSWASGTVWPEYADDLMATQAVFGVPDLVETAGSVVLLTYFSIPELLTVQPVRADGGSLRTFVDGHRERSFLESIVGLATDERMRGGIANPEVRARADLLRRRHLQYSGMTPEYMTFVAALLAVAPLSVCDHYGTPPCASDRASYWRYMTRAMLLLGADLDTEKAVNEDCHKFVTRGCGRCAEGAELIEAYTVRHPTHVMRAVPAMFPQARRVVREVTEHVHR